MDADSYFNFNSSQLPGSDIMEAAEINFNYHNIVGEILISTPGIDGLVDKNPRRIKAPIPCLDLI